MNDRSMRVYLVSFIPAVIGENKRAVIVTFDSPEPSP